MSSNDDYSFYLTMKTLTNYLAYLVTVVLFPLGFIFNIISIVVFRRKNLREHPISFYNIIILINNNLVILINFIVYFTLSLSNDALLWSNSSCQFFSAATRITTSMASWLYVAITMNRIRKICFQNKFPSLTNTKKKLFTKLSFIVLVIFIVVLVTNIPHFYFGIETTNTFDTTTNKTIVKMLCTAPKNIIYIRDLIAIIVRAIVPLVIIGILNTILIFKLRIFKRKIESNSSNKKEYIFTYSVVVFNVFFIISLTPYVISLYFFNLQQENPSISITSKVYVITNWIYYFSLFLTLYNFCFSFLVNLKFNVYFRDEFFQLYYEIRNFL